MRKSLRSSLVASLCLAPLATACTDDGETGDNEGPGIIATPAAGCTTDVPNNQVVVACDFGPGIRPFAATSGRVYTVSPVGTYSAVDLAYSAKTLLYRYQFSTTTTAMAWGTVIQDGRLYFPGDVVEDGGVRSALLSIDATTPTPDEQATVVAWGDQYELRAPMFGDDERLYAKSTVIEGFGASSGPVVSIGYDGDGLVPRTAGYGMPIGLVGDTLYYLRDRTIARMPKTGGTAEVIATELSDGSSMTAPSTRTTRTPRPRPRPTRCAGSGRTVSPSRLRRIPRAWRPPVGAAARPAPRRRLAVLHAGKQRLHVGIARARARRRHRRSSTWSPARTSRRPCSIPRASTSATRAVAATNRSRASSCRSRRPLRRARSDGRIEQVAALAALQHAA